MSSQTSLVAEQVRLRQWAAQIQECQSRPADMKVETWCSEHGITKANYYYAYAGLEKHAWKLVIQNRLCGTSNASSRNNPLSRFLRG